MLWFILLNVVLSIQNSTETTTKQIVTNTPAASSAIVSTIVPTSTIEAETKKVETTTTLTTSTKVETTTKTAVPQVQTTKAIPQAKEQEKESGILIIVFSVAAVLLVLITLFYVYQKLTMKPSVDFERKLNPFEPKFHV